MMLYNIIALRGKGNWLKLLHLVTLKVELEKQQVLA